MKDAWRTHPTHGLTLEMMEIILKRAWSRATASLGCQATWSPENPAYGQCAVTTAMLWKTLKKEERVVCEILRADVEGFGSHYWLRLPDGTEVDMTRSQFPEGTIIPPGEPRTIEYLLDSDRAKSARTRERADLLEETFDEIGLAWMTSLLVSHSEQPNDSASVQTTPPSLPLLEDAPSLNDRRADAEEPETE